MLSKEELEAHEKAAQEDPVYQAVRALNDALEGVGSPQRVLYATNGEVAFIRMAGPIEAEKMARAQREGTSRAMNVRYSGANPMIGE